MIRSPTKTFILQLLAVVPLVTSLAMPPALVDVFIGSIAGGVGALAVYPIDYVKTQLQTETGRRKYDNGPHALSTIIADEGPLALYRGSTVQVVGVAPEKAIKLTVNDVARSALLAPGSGLPPFAGELLAGAVAGVCQVIVTNPLEVLKVALQTSGPAKSVGSDLWREVGGLGGLYRGADACILRDATFSLILFPLYHYLKEFMQANQEISFVSVPLPVLLGFAGMVAAAPAAYLTTPMDVVKTRQQSRDSVDGTAVSRRSVTYARHREFPQRRRSLISLNMVPRQGKTSSGKNVADMNALDLARDILASEGPTVFFSGGMERIARSAPQFGITLALFDVLKTFATIHGWLQVEALS